MAIDLTLQCNTGKDFVEEFQDIVDYDVYASWSL